VKHDYLRHFFSGGNNQPTESENFALLIQHLDKNTTGRC